jgi:hypothetical protein
MGKFGNTGYRTAICADISPVRHNEEGHPQVAFFISGAGSRQLSPINND